MAEKSKSNEIHLTRVYDAPVRAVWEAWTDPEQVAQWWGPRGFTITTHSKDLRPGGTWVYTMHGPDGTDYPNRTHYFEVEECARLVYDHGANEERPALFRVTVLFISLGEQTRMEMTMTLATPEAAEQTRGFIKSAGGNATWDRLGEHLGKRASGEESFVIHRSFEAPIGLVFSMWTAPEHLVRWLPPSGFGMELIRADMRPGGSAFYKMSNGETSLHGRIQHREIEAPNRLVYAQQFCDERENVSRHPMAPVWPETMLTTVTFVEEGPNQTRVRVVWEPASSTTREERHAFVQEKSGMTLGWTGSFDKLEDYLAD